MRDYIANPLEVYPVKAYFYGRFSSKEQRKGNSSARQIELAKSWCERHQIAYDETLSYFDKGLSAFRGDQRKKGGLGLFMKACEQGRIGRGSYLLVESLDRLSRENLFEGEDLVRQLLRVHGIVIVTLMPEMEFSAANYETTHWLIKAEFQRAHSESKMKSLRSKDNWERRRKKISGSPLTAKLPLWCHIVEDKIVLIEEKAQVIRRIFDLSSKGFGGQSIAKKFNKEKVKPLGRSTFWHPSYIEKVLANRAVLGEFQPRRGEDGKRVPVGSIIKNYFPPVITENQWAASRSAMVGRRHQRGLISNKVTNLFTKLVYEKGEVMSLKVPGGKPRLQRASLRTPGIAYYPFEKVFLWWIKEVNITLNNTGDDYESIKKARDTLESSIKSLEFKIKMDYTLVDQMDTLSEWKKRLKNLNDKLEAATVPLQSTFLHSKRLIEMLDKAEGDEKEALRREIKLAVRQTVRSIHVEIKKDGIDRHVQVKVGLKGEPVKYQYWYVTRQGKIIAGGNGLRMIETDPEIGMGTYQFSEDRFPIEKTKVETVRDTVAALRIAGKSYKEIEAETGLHRVTIAEHLKARGLTKKK